jgi:Chitobiase/beta-hexosaminidase C-terminal domain
MRQQSNKSLLNVGTDTTLTRHRKLLFIAVALILWAPLTIEPYKAIAATAAAPTYSPTSGGYRSIQTVTISDATSGATIYYTANGVTPTSKSTKYSGPITVSASTNFQAIAILSGSPASPVTKAWYTIVLDAATPVISPTPGIYNTIQSVTLKDSTPGAIIHYTLDGSYPTISSPVYGGPIKATTTTSIISTASAPSFDASPAVRATYTIVAPPPSISPESGTFTDTTKVTMSDAVPGAVIHYTKDGSTPTASSPVYPGPLTVSPQRTTSEVYQALATASGYYESSPSIATFTVTLPAGVLAQATVKTSPKLTIPPDFMGLSMFWNFPSGVMGQASTGVNQPYRTLVSNLTQYYTAPMLIRVLGDDSQTSDIQADTEPLLEFSQAVNVNYTLGVDLWHNNLSLAEAETAAWTNAIPNDLIQAIEIGNEPNCYEFNGARLSTYDFAEYLPQFQQWKAGVQASAGWKIGIMGPSYGQPTKWTYTTWIASAEAALASGALGEKIVSQHAYGGAPTQDLTTGAPWPTNYLLEPIAATQLPDENLQYSTAVHQAGKKFRIGEMNTFWAGGVEGISNTFSAALWSIDIMFNYANEGVDGVNWHSGQGIPYQLYQFTVHTSDGEATTYAAAQVNPIYYGLLVFAQMAGRDAKLLPVTTSTDANVSIWATVDNTSTAHMVVINKDQKATGSVKITLPGYTTGTVRYLGAASYLATNGVTLGGQTFDDSPEGTIRGELVTTIITANDGVFTLPNMPITCAAVIDFSD